MIGASELLITHSHRRLQAMLVYLSVPPDERSRMLCVLSVCIGLGPIGIVVLASC